MPPRPSLHRLQIITGATGLDALAATRVIIFGIGGVGSWCAEALIRSGIGHLTIVDSDVVCVTNINRQLQATTSTVGKPKVQVLRERLLDINPSADIVPLQAIFDKNTAPSFGLATFHYVIDAIDSLSNKVELIIRASESGAKVLTSLGASNKLDASRIRVASLWETEGCPLGRFVRKRLRRRGFHGEVMAVYSREQLPLQPVELHCGSGSCVCPTAVKGPDGQMLPAHEWCSSKKQINGSAAHITGTFGFMLAGLVIQDALAQAGVALENDRTPQVEPQDDGADP